MLLLSSWAEVGCAASAEALQAPVLCSHADSVQSSSKRLKCQALTGEEQGEMREIPSSHL